MQYLPSFLLLLGILLVYLPAVNGQFIFDDLQYIQGNPLLRDVQGLWKIWFDPRANPQYYPLTFTTFWLEFQWWQLWPTGYHLTNILLHGVNAILLWRILQRLAVPGAWIAAAIFALHPVQVESVAWISERKNVLSGFFALLSVLLSLRFYSLETTPSHSPQVRLLLYLSICGSFLAALLSKTAICVLPAILLLLLWWKRDRVAYKYVFLFTPLFMTSIIFAILTTHLEHNPEIVGAVGDKWNFTFFERILIAGRGIYFYLEKILFPTNLSFIYPRWNMQRETWWQYLLPCSIHICLTITFFLGRKNKNLAVIILYFLVMSLPVLGFVDFYFMKFSFVADHFQYLSCIGIIAGIVGWRWSKDSNIFLQFKRDRSIEGDFQPYSYQFLLSAAVLLLLAILTWNRAGIYKDSITLWSDTINKNPSSWVGYNNLGWELIRHRDFRSALPYLEKAIELGPKEDQAHSNLSIVLFATGDIEGALQHAKSAVIYRAKSAAYASNLSMIYWRKGDLPKAVHYARAALRKGPIEAQVYYNVGLLALQDVPTPEAFSLAEAVSYIERAVLLEPESLSAIRLLAWLRATSPEHALRDGEQATVLAEKACQRTGYGDPDLLDTLAAAYAANGQFDAAVETVRTAAELARASKKLVFENKIRERLTLYLTQRPYYNTTQEKFPS
jgi:Flp pilus assembly protein TadD